MMRFCDGYVLLFFNWNTTVSAGILILKNFDLTDLLEMSRFKLHYHVRRSRTYFSSKQLKVLEEAFEKTPYPDVVTREQLAVSISLPESRIQVMYIIYWYISKYLLYNPLFFMDGKPF